MQGNEIRQNNHSQASYDSYLRGDCFVARLHGRFIEHGQAAALIAEIGDELGKSRKHFVIDLAGVEYLNSAGIGDIISLIRIINKAKAQLVFVKVPQKVKELLEIIRLNCMLDVCSNEEEAIQSLLN